MDIKQLYTIFSNSTGVSTDSRNIKQGQIFFALKGENFNGNKYAEKALEQGAAYAVTDEKVSDNEKIILVDNVLDCMQRLATFHRSRLGIPVIAITGTNGKTTTKELISKVLSKKYNVAYTQGNLNNHIGVPLTLLSFTDDTEIAVVEMGASHKGEIEVLCQIAQPNYGIITNIGKAHLEGFGSFDNIVATKSELYHYLDKNDGYIFYNEDNPLLNELTSGLNSASYGMTAGADTLLQLVDDNEPFLKIRWAEYLVSTKLVGDYNFDNVAAAVCIGEYFKVPNDLIVEALSEYKPQNNRSQLHKTENNNTVIIDAYNANPESMYFSIVNFNKFPDKDKVLIIGDMLELGANSQSEHDSILHQIKELGFGEVFLVGNEFYALREKYPEYNFMKNTDDMCNYLSNENWHNRTILLKASRGIRLENTLQML